MSGTPLALTRLPATAIYCVVLKRWIYVHGYDTDETICRTNGWGRPNDLSVVPLHPDAFVLTNPPYLAKNSAKRMGSPSVAYFSTETAQTMNHSHANILDDVFKLAIEQTLPHYEESMWIVPESVVQDLEHLLTGEHAFIR